MSVFVLNPSGEPARRRNHGTTEGVKKSWATRRARYGDAGDSPAVQALHLLGITGRSLQRGGGGARAKARAVRQRGLPRYWRRLLAPRSPAGRKARQAPRRAPAAKRTAPRSARRPNAYFGHREAHSGNAKVKWTGAAWPKITLYTFIKRHGVLGGQRAYARYLREHNITLTRRRGGGLGRKRARPAGKESGMARRRKRRSNPRGRRRSALALLAPKRRRRKSKARARTRARRSNPPARKRAPKRGRAKARGRRRRNPPILWQANPAPRKRRKRRARAAAPRRSRRRRNPPILWQANPTKRRRSSKRRSPRRAARRGARRHNPDFSLGGIKRALMDAIPTLEDARMVGTMTSFGLLQEMFAWRLFDKLGFRIWEYVPWADHVAFTLFGTIGATLLGGRRWAQPVLYGGLSEIARSIAVDKMRDGTLGATMQQYAPSGSGGAVADYVTYGDRKAIPGGGWGPVSDRIGLDDFVTFGNETDNASAESCSVEPGGAELSDYYGVTAY